MAKRVILALETSCDETAAAIVRADIGASQVKGVEILSNVVASQAALHAKFGGVFPEFAAREHVKVIMPTIEAALVEAFPLQAPITNHQSLITKVDAIAVTYGPGLVGSLLIGTNVANALGYATQKPLIPVNHLDGHFFSTFVPDAPPFPLVALIVSGGHTELFVATKPFERRLLGRTRDDAVGEAFDKVANLLGLPYPGGPAIGALAHKGNPKAYAFPRAPQAGYDFSYSGLKTAVLRQTQTMPKLSQQDRADLAASFQAAAIQQLLAKLEQAVAQYTPKSLIVGGGVAANALLQERVRERFSSLEVRFPIAQLQTDNAAMIGIAALWQWLRQSPHNRYDVEAVATIVAPNKRSFQRK